VSAPLTLGKVSRFFAPLALSWMLMSAETPVAVSILSQGGNDALIAGFLVVMGLSIWIESPVIDLLATGTTFARNAHNLRVLQKFALILMSLVTLAHAAVAFTPLYDWLVRDVLGVPDAVRDVARVPFQIMTPWSALIGWRRWRQGVMIRAGRTRPVSVGTILRLFTIFGFGWGLARGTNLGPLEAVAAALVLSVAFECAFIHFAAGPALHQIAQASPDPGPLLSLRELWRFHWPLTGATLVMMLSSPLIAASVSRVESSVLHMASWQTALAITSMFRSITFGLSEVIIALGHDDAAHHVLRQFCARVGLGLSGLILVLWLTQADAWIFTHVLSASPEVLALARQAFLMCLAMPLLGAAIGYAKGRLTQAKLTLARLWGIVAGIGALALGLTLGVQYGWPGVVVAAVGIVMSQSAELTAYVVLWRRHLRRQPVLGPSA